MSSTDDDFIINKDCTDAAHTVILHPEINKVLTIDEFSTFAVRHIGPDHGDRGG